ncbi:unnamed protein product [Hymenolepis diminuta]|uniref:DUF3010 domain-containing protein n=1 Tax=Hymenolepis diminuta TaxID=6216 RepID=A0A0R3SVH7_HYMDI|nr:unnamed protein product [Hymenolepis diminuta]
MFHDVNMTIEPLVLETQIKICFPFLESTSNSSLISTCDATFIVEIENVSLKKFGGVRIKGKGTFNKVVGLFVNNGLFDRLIREQIVLKMRKMLPKKFAELREKICYKIDRFVAKTIERYAIKPTK